MASLLVAVGALAPCAVAFADVDSCLQAAATQSEMTKCAGVAYADARRELDRVLQQIRTSYAEYPEFISALTMAQDAWQRSFDADLEMHYPGPDKFHQYGSAYAMCAGLDKIALTLARVEFLKRWLNGEEGNVCGGSIINKDCLDHDCSTLRDPHKPSN